MLLLDESVLLFEAFGFDPVNAAGLLLLRRPGLAKQSNLGEVGFVFQKFHHQLDVDMVGEDEVVFEVEDVVDVIVEGVPAGLDGTGQTSPRLVLHKFEAVRTEAKFLA